ncbi:ATP-binding protein [Janibacter sp. RAF20_2_2]|uniref:sensor histidine kinase n=1 Tax=unclassified Janibacter TaxID=2649294 RepID=UPI003F8D958B
MSIAPVTGTGDWQTSQVLPRLVIAVIYLAVVVDLQLRGERLVHVVALCVPLLLASMSEALPVTSDVAPGLTVGALALSAARLLRPRGYLSVMLPAGAAHVTARVVAGGSGSTALSDVVVGVGMTWAVYGFVQSLYLAAGRSADADAETARQRVSALEESADRRAVAAAGRALHDDVLVVLRTIAGGRGGVGRIRQMCAQAVRAVADIEAAIVATERAQADVADGQHGVRALARELERSTPTGFHVDVVGADASCVIPKASYEALRRALGEALRNVSRHSGLAAAEVRFDVTDDVLSAQVVDHGTGMAESMSPGYGLSVSIRETVEDVGGRVQVGVTPGGGVTVLLEMPLTSRRRRSVLEREYDLTLRAIGSARPILSITWPVAVVWLYTAVRYSWAWPTPAVSLTLALLHGAITALVLHRVLRGAPTARWLVMTQGGLLIVNAVSLALSPAGSLLDYRSWPMGFLAVPLVVLMMVLPARVALVILTPHALLVLLAVWVRPELSAGVVPVASLNAVLATPIAALVLGRLMRRIGRHIEAEEEESERLSAVRAARASMAAVDQQHLARAREAVVPWLRAIAAGAVDPMAAPSREQARLLASEVRDDLYAPGFVTGALHPIVTGFRQRGGTFTVRPSEPVSTSDDGIRGVLAEVLASLDGGRRVTVSLVRRGPGTLVGARIAIIPPVSSPVPGDLRRCTVESDAFSTTIVVGAPQPQATGDRPAEEVLAASE